MAKWPNVPAVYGWLALDRRGNWLLQGEPINNPVVTEYIGRNYDRDDSGRWFFQNGPQRVFVALAYTPWVYRAVSGGSEPLAIESHTGKRAAALSGAWIDEEGALLLQTEQGIGVLHDRDLESALAALVDADGKAMPEAALDNAMALVSNGQEASLWLELCHSKARVQAIRSADVPERFTYVQRPAEDPEQPAIASAR